MGETVRREVELSVDRAAAWAEVSRLAGWLADEVDLVLSPGAQGTFRWADGTRRDAVVEEVEPGRRLAFTWCGEDGEPSLVELTLDDAPAGGTILTVVEVPLVELRVASRAVVAGSERAGRGPAMVAACA